MFWDLNGATDIPRRTRQRQMAATVTLLPTWDAVPTTNSDIALVYHRVPDHKTDALLSGTPAKNAEYYQKFHPSPVKQIFSSRQCQDINKEKRKKYMQ